MQQAHQPEGDQGRERRRAARRALEALPAGIARSVITCPLCGARAPARGLRARELRAREAEGGWDLVFTCPSCGLITAFDAAGLSPQRLRAVQGSRWAALLRRSGQALPESLRYTRRAGRAEFAGTLVVAYLTWLLLTASLSPIDLLWGLGASLLVAVLTYRYAAIRLPGRLLTPRRMLAMLALLAEFARQIVVQNLTLAARVWRPDLPIRPGIVAVPTALADDLPLTLLGSLVTLTPDTVALDIDQKRGILYVHWIDVKTTDPLEAQKLISASLEDKISRWLL